MRLYLKCKIKKFGKNLYILSTYVIMQMNLRKNK